MRTNRVLGALAVALLSSCADYGAPDEVLYGEAVYTQPAPGVNFAGFGTYYLDPEYTEVNGDSLRPVALPPSVETSIESNMAALGYTRIDTGDQAADLGAADVGLKVSVLSGSVAVYYPGYWCDYWYYYSCYYNWYYAGSYEVGSVILEMGNLSGYPPAAGERLEVLWLGAVYGVVSTQALDIPRVVDGINRAFGQSPYLGTN